MTFALNVILVLATVFVLEVYFVKTILKSINILFPNVSQNKLKFAKWIILTNINIYPIIAIAAWIYVYASNSGYFSPPENIFFDYLILYPFWLGTIIVIQTSIFFIFLEIINFVFSNMFKQKNVLVKLKSVIFFGIFIITLIYVPSRIVYDYHMVDIRNVLYQKEGLPESLEGLKIAFVSDIQADRYTDEKRLENFIDKLNSTNPDLVLIAGDMITSTPQYIDQSARQLGKIKSKYGIYTCVGDHDNWAYRGDILKSRNEVIAALAQRGIPMIDNNKMVLGIDSANIEVTFITNTYSEKVKESVLDSLSRNSNKADLRIFLTHQPKEFLMNKAYDNKFDLYLCGHTHGGQITFLFPFYHLSPTLVETTYMRGDFRFGNMLMIVTRGLGMSLAPLRFNSTPEITIITLQNKLLY